MKKLLGSYGREDEFRAVAEQIISEEEKKNNRVLARSLRKTLENASSPKTAARALAPLIPFPDAASDFVERVEPRLTKNDLILSSENIRIFLDLIREYRRADDIHRHGLSVRSKLLFCGPPGCGKTISAEVFSAEIGLPLFTVKLDRLISSYLGETATNIRKIFEFARTQPCILFLDEFDALARARDDASDHHELRRVVNSLLLFIDRIRPKGFLIAATNLDDALDPAVWRRFDEVVWFDRPDRSAAARYLKLKFRNAKLSFDPTRHLDALKDYSYSELERICLSTIKASIIDRRNEVRERDFTRSLADEQRRRQRAGRLNHAA